MLVAERNRLYIVHSQSKKSINIIVKALEDELARIDEDMNNHMRNHFKGLAARLSSIKGVGTMTVAVLSRVISVYHRKRWINKYA